jgi:hypothetical protein
MIYSKEVDNNPLYYRHYLLNKTIDESPIKADIELIWLQAGIEFAKKTLLELIF